MEKTCSACGQAFRPAFVFQIAVTPAASATTFARSSADQRLGAESYRPSAPAASRSSTRRGGTGKTTTAVNLAAGLAEREREVLLIDTDAQGNVAYRSASPGEQSLYHVLVDGADPTEASVPVRQHPRRHHRRRDARRRRDLAGAPEPRAALEDHDAKAQPHAGVPRYDYVIIDCGPSLNLLNQNALSYADEVIIPVTCDYLALVGVKQVLRTMRTSNATLKHAVRISAVLPTFYDGRTRPRPRGP